MNIILHKKVWADVLNKPRQENIFREFRGEMMNLGIGYDDQIWRLNTSNGIAGVVPEEEIETRTMPNKSYTDMQ